jgi:hypothetical protein
MNSCKWDGKTCLTHYTEASNKNLYRVHGSSGQMEWKHCCRPIAFDSLVLFLLLASLKLNDQHLRSCILDVLHLALGAAFIISRGVVESLHISDSSGALEKNTLGCPYWTQSIGGSSATIVSTG